MDRNVFGGYHVVELDVLQTRCEETLVFSLGTICLRDADYAIGAA